jgi:hypothetical protein
MTAFDKLLVLLGNPFECSEETAEVCLSMAEDAVLDYIGRDKVPKGAESIVIKLAVIYYNRLGNEGESSRTEGGISQSFVTDIPEDIKRQLHNYPRKVGVIHSETVEE